MDGPSVEHSDSDSGESWTLLENNSVYADEPPEFIEEHVNRCGAQHHEKDEDTDGISIISDSDHDHEAPIPTPGEEAFEKCQMSENYHPEKDITDTVNPHLSNINDDDDDLEPAINEDFLGDSHARHKTYVHKRNKRLSTVLNIIVLGSVITAAGVAIGHMWGAKNDCTLQTTSSVNKILSNLYKLQEENAYLRSKLKEFTHSNNQQMQHKIPVRNAKCKKVFEESLNNYEPKKLTKCVDEIYKNSNYLIDHKIKPKFEKEFIADIDKLKTVYLQNKSWLDDEISRRMKIEEKLLQKYKDEVNSAKDESNDSIGENNEGGFNIPDAKVHRDETFEKFPNVKILESDIPTQSKLTYADSLKAKEKPRFKRNEERYETDDNKGSLSMKQPPYFVDQEFKSEVNDDDDDGSVGKDKNSREDEHTGNDHWSEAKPKFRRNEERYENDYDNSILMQSHKDDNYRKEEQIKHNDGTEEKPKFRRNEERYETEGDTWSKNTYENKNLRKKEKRNSTKNGNKQNPEDRKNNSYDNRMPEYSLSEDDITKDNRYVVNKMKQEKKKNGHVNSNKKQKRKSKYEKLNMKGEFGEKLETPEDFVLKQPDDKYNFDHKSSVSNIDVTEGPFSCNSELNDKCGKFLNKEVKIEKRNENKDQGANWFERRAIFRTEARKKYYEQFGETSPNNSSWYFRRMRKREQCRIKGDNSTFRKLRKEKHHQKMKH